MHPSSHFEKIEKKTLSRQSCFIVTVWFYNSWNIVQTPTICWAAILCQTLFQKLFMVSHLFLRQSNGGNYISDSENEISERVSDLSQIVLWVAEAELGYKFVFLRPLFFASTPSCFAHSQNSTGSRMTNCSSFPRKERFLECGTFNVKPEKVSSKPRRVGRFIWRHLSHGYCIVSKTMQLFQKLLIPVTLSAQQDNCSDPLGQTQRAASWNSWIAVLVSASRGKNWACYLSINPSLSCNFRTLRYNVWNILSQPRTPIN